LSSVPHVVLGMVVPGLAAHRWKCGLEQGSLLSWVQSGVFQCICAGGMPGVQLDWG
jgi:hypothetical protein